MSSTRANSTPMDSMTVHRLVRLLDDWGHGDGPLHAQLADRLRRLIVVGKLTAGARLPSERALAVALGVSRNTVGAAFDELRGDRLLISRRGDGTYVRSARRQLAARGDDRLESFLPDGRGEGLDRIDLRSAALPGLPMVVDEIDRSLTDDLRPLVASHGYLPSGLPVLRERVAEYYRDLGLPTTPEQIVITSGAQQAMRMVAASMLEPGSVVLVEEPSFRGAIEVLRSAGARLVPIRRGSAGIEVSALAQAAARFRPALLMLQSTVHNPTGGVMDVDRRRRLAIAADELHLPVLDDTTLADAVIDGPPPLPMAAWGREVITVGSVSKSFWGGLRVGWLRADAARAASLASIKAGEDLGTSLLAQATTAQLLPLIDQARSQRRAALAEARAIALDRIAELLPDWRPVVPTGGASLWIRLPITAATELVQRAERLGVQVLPGPTFSSIDGLDDHLRVSIAAPIEEITTGLCRLAEAWHAVTHRRSEPRRNASGR